MSKKYAQLFMKLEIYAINIVNLHICMISNQWFHIYNIKINLFLKS